MLTPLQKLLRLLLLVLVAQPVLAQDTLTVMTWNLTNYGYYFADCPSTGTNSNSMGEKDPHIQTVVSYVQPHLLSVNEMATGNASAPGRIMSQALNINGATWYAQAPFNFTSGSSLGNAIYYDTRKLVLKSKRTINTTVRLVDWCVFYWNSPQLAQGDTVFLNVLSAHLKAGNTAADASSRGQQAATIMNALAAAPAGNYMITGDFNLYGSSEAAWQALTSSSVANHPAVFQDPVNRVGSWSNNASFADVHTQCPSNGFKVGCYSGGGLDDRFDFILMNGRLINGTSRVKYLPGTYRAVGQDGLRYNREIDNPTNNSVPYAVAQALYRASDHLPVMARLRFSTVSSTLKQAGANPQLHITSAGQQGSQLQFVLHASQAQSAQVSLTDAAGRLVNQLSIEITPGQNNHSMAVQQLPAGIYLLNVQGQNGQTATTRIAIQ